MGEGVRLVHLSRYEDNGVHKRSFKLSIANVGTRIFCYFALRCVDDCQSSSRSPSDNLVRIKRV